MSDDKVTLPRREVVRSRMDRMYRVLEKRGLAWVEVSKGYPHSTSAYAKLGRMTQHDTV